MTREPAELNEKLLEGDENSIKKSPPDSELSSSSRDSVKRQKLGNVEEEEGEEERKTWTVMVNNEFYQRDNWFDEMCEILFKLKRRKTNFRNEIYYGLIQFISCLYVLAVVPQQLEQAGYDFKHTICAVAVCSGVGSIFCGLFANLPFILAPPTVVSIFLSVFLQQYGYATKTGNTSVIISGFALMLFGYRPFGHFFSHLIPIPIQAGTAIGIGLLTALAGSTEIGLVEQGQYNVLRMGEISPEVMIALSGVILICIAMIYHVKGSFCIAVVVCSLIWWIYDGDYPRAVVTVPAFKIEDFTEVKLNHIPLLTTDLFFLYILYLNGLLTSLSSMANLSRQDGAIPRGRWVFIIAGSFTVLSGLMSSSPILVSPESSAGIKAGAKTGLSTVFCGILFLVSVFFSPIFQQIPAAGTGPLLIVIGIMLFQNVNRINWRNVKESAPAFIVLFYIPFTYSIIQGVALGYVAYIVINISTGDMFDYIAEFLLHYFPAFEDKIMAVHDVISGFFGRFDYEDHISAAGGAGAGAGGPGGAGLLHTGMRSPSLQSPGSMENSTNSLLGDGRDGTIDISSIMHPPPIMVGAGAGAGAGMAAGGEGYGSVGRTPSLSGRRASFGHDVEAGERERDQVARRSRSNSRGAGAGGSRPTSTDGDNNKDDRDAAIVPPSPAPLRRGISYLRQQRSRTMSNPPARYAENFDLALDSFSHTEEGRAEQPSRYATFGSDTIHEQGSGMGAGMGMAVGVGMSFGGGMVGGLSGKSGGANDPHVHLQRAVSPLNAGSYGAGGISGTTFTIAATAPASASAAALEAGETGAGSMGRAASRIEEGEEDELPGGNSSSIRSSCSRSADAGGGIGGYVAPKYDA